ncbi:MAG: hypothetical protein ACKVP3_06915 [Hyphomicrobiaceae bacterium]
MSPDFSTQIQETSHHLGWRQALARPATQLVEWQGVSGRTYQHIVYSLIDCPRIPEVNYVLARRGADGERRVLKIGRTDHDAQTLNLARIRHEGALLGANEVHLYVIARTDTERAQIEFDFAAGMYGHRAPAVRH